MCALQHGKELSFSSIGFLLLDRLNNYAAVIHPFLSPKKFCTFYWQRIKSQRQRIKSQLVQYMMVACVTASCTVHDQMCKGTFAR